MKTRSYVFVAGLLISFIAALGILTTVSAAPAAPVDILITQPDGSVFTARQWGDEWLNGFETPTGYTIIQDKNDRWVYADLTLDGSLLPFIEDGSTIQVGDPVPAGLSVNLRPALSIPEDWLTSPPVLETRSAGNRPILVLLVSFSNRASTYPASHFQNIIFGNSGSVKDYYLKASFNQLNFVPAAESHGTANDGIVGWLNLGYPHPNTGSNLNNIANQKTVKDALIAADPFVNYAAFDTNGDGHISSDELNIIVVAAGFERSYSDHTPSVWAHRWNLNQVGPPTLDGVTIGDFYKNGGYSQVGEIHQDHSATFGIIAHELGHDIGWPDLYDTSGASDGVGNWDIMAGGAWNRTGSNPQGTSPALPNAWLKWYQGWITPTAVNGTLTGQSIPQAATNPTAFLLRPNPNGVDWRFYVKSGVGEFFLVENRQLTGYDQGLPGPGLLIWHIDESVTSTNEANANYNRPLVKLIQADGLDHLRSRANNNRGDDGDPFPGSTNNRTFNFSSNPSSKLHISGLDSLVQVTNISNSATTMTANLTYGSGATQPSAPTGVSASEGTFTDKVRVTWGGNPNSGNQGFLPMILSGAGSSGTPGTLREAPYFQVFRHTSNSTSGATKIKDHHLNSPYDDTSAVPGTTYYYWVKACNSAGCSGFSASDTGWCSTTSGIANGDFEAGRDGSWTEYSSRGEPIITQFEPGAAHSGVWAVWMGGLHDSVDRLSQSVTISASQPYLHFWYWIYSEDSCGFDHARVKFNTTTIKTYNLCTTNNTGTWKPAVLNLSAYSGSTATLVFEVTTDSYLLSSFYLDDVSLSASATAAPDPTQGGTLIDVTRGKRQLEGLK